MVITQEILSQYIWLIWHKLKLYIPECCPNQPNTHISVSTQIVLYVHFISLAMNVKCPFWYVVIFPLSVFFPLPWHVYSSSLPFDSILQGSCQIKNTSFLMLEVHFYNDLREFLTFKSQLFQPTYCTVLRGTICFRLKQNKKHIRHVNKQIFKRSHTIWHSIFVIRKTAGADCDWIVI